MQNNQFIVSQTIDTHPMARSKKKEIRTRYYYILEHFISQVITVEGYTKSRLRQYETSFLGNTSPGKAIDIIEAIPDLVSNKHISYRARYRYLLLCDFALILLDKKLVRSALQLLKSYLTKRQCVQLDNYFQILFSGKSIPKQYAFSCTLADQFLKNYGFINLPEKRILVTANMSAGKSTLINAIVGKNVAQTSQEACTSSLCYLYSKAFEDDTVHTPIPSISFRATDQDLKSNAVLEKNQVASYFRTTVKPHCRVCIIDTPGVNSAINPGHSKLTYNALVEEKYDTLLYVLNASRLGTDDELRYLKYVSNNVPKGKIIFVLNKLDVYKKADDSIELSIDAVKNDLRQLGHDDPIVCPFSAYFAYLLKMKQAGRILADDDEDSYGLFARKFIKPEYDLSKHYCQWMTGNFASGDELFSLSVKCGLHGLETILFGG